MKKLVPYFLTLSIGVLLGASITLVSAQEPENQKENNKLAYLIVSSDRLAGVTGEDYAPYMQAAGPLARSAGINVVAPSQKPVVLEGEWPHGNIIIETFRSMDALNEFWYSDGYQQAKELRQGLAKVNFIMAVEGN